ncbi:hypothetical protein [Clostridium butyricum]|uniref:hypothetical protein n=1 Tax=Clostridium butyricum TaxID=1492 RepID=UPI00374E7194
MRSFALWFSKINKDSTEDKEVTVHINLWDKRQLSEKKYCFDFGLLLEDIRHIENIFLYVPFNIDKTYIKDLGAVISNNKLVNAIFNESFTTTDGEPKRLVVNGTGDKDSFVIYNLDIENQIELSSCKRNFSDPGTIIKIKVNDIIPTKIFRYYFRIRIEVDCEAVYLINDEIKGTSIFSNEFTNTEVIDFRLNDIRSCSENLREQFDKGNRFHILAVHYLILRNANDIIIHYGEPISSRMLENDLWKDYIEGANNNIIAYHIKKKSKRATDKEVIKYVDDFSDLTRFQYQKGNWTVLIKYIIGVIAFGAIGGVFGNILSGLLGI